MTTSAVAAPAPVHERLSQVRVFMDTAVEVEVWTSDTALARASIARAFNWFHLVEQTCSRFDPDSELSRLSRTMGRPVSVSPVLLHALAFALVVAEMSDGAFDPTVGDAMVLRGFDRHFRTGRTVAHLAARPRASYRDVVIHPARGEVTLTAPLTLDLGAVAKGLAVDLASAELQSFTACSVSAGGDLFARGAPPETSGWDVGVRDPHKPDQLLRRLCIRDRGVCTSGNYFRGGPDGGAPHLLHGHTLRPSTGFASVTVVAPSAMTADALTTAAFALGPLRAPQFLRRAEVDGLFVTDTGGVSETAGMVRFR